MTSAKRRTNPVPPVSYDSKTMTPKQTLFLRLGVAAAILAFAFAPFHTRGSYCHSTGFHFIFYPGHFAGDVDTTLLLIELAIIGTATWAAVQSAKPRQ
jgi:hypothetical protein